MKIFWSWQSDTPGKTGRFFVREVLDDAVERLKEKNEVDEPQERESKSALHVDQDRQGVAGSPDLAATILKKIKETAVFVADVTPVGEVLSGEENSKKKKIINSNVAIELGYALNHPGDGALIMVMNTHYGQVEDLPFDLRHKAGPIRYCLAPDADKETISTEYSKLKGSLVAALRPYVSSGSFKEESYKERFARQEKEKRAAQEREGFLTSEAGVQAAKIDFEKLCDEILRQAADVGLNVDKLRQGNFLYMVFEKIGFSLGWNSRFSNTLDKSALELSLWNGTPPIPGRINYDEPSKIASRTYKFDIDREKNTGWIGANGSLLGVAQLAEESLRFLTDKVHERAIRGKDRAPISFV